jgi:membrane associated rhomboid family serine protease
MYDKYHTYQIKDDLPKSSKNYSYIILAACVLIFILYNLIGINLSMFMLEGNYVLSRPWTFITYQFLHGNFNHLIFNMIFMFFFAPALEERVGSNKFLSIYIISGIVAGIGHILTSVHPVVGASGSLFGIFACLAMIAPHIKIYVYFIPMKITHAVILFAFMDIIMLGSNDPIARVAHLSGLLVGLIYGTYLKNS